MIKRIFEVKDGRSYRETYRTTDEAEVYKSFSSELMNKLVFKSPYYTRMTQYNNYDGTRTVIFYQTNGRSVYTVKA